MARIVTFSVRERRTKETQLIDWYRRHSISVGPDFSSLCLAALKHYKETVLDGKVCSWAKVKSFRAY